jgi:hypothetical protein
MKMFYSPSKGAMFNDAVYGNAIPEDAVQIPANRLDEILAGLGLQKTLVVGEGGDLVLVDPVPVVPTLEQLAAVERTWRSGEVSRVLWLRERHRDQLEIAGPTTLTTEQFNALLVYMQELRDWPQSPDFPDSQHRPTAPNWMAEQVQ